MSRYSSIRSASCSGTIVRALQEADLIDEYRLIPFPAAVGDGRRLFPAGTMLDLDSSERTGPGSLTVHTTRR